MLQTGSCLTSLWGLGGVQFAPVGPVSVFFGGVQCVPVGPVCGVLGGVQYVPVGPVLFCFVGVQRVSVCGFCLFLFWSAVCSSGTTLCFVVVVCVVCSVFQ